MLPMLHFYGTEQVDHGLSLDDLEQSTALETQKALVSLFISYHKGYAISMQS